MRLLCCMWNTPTCSLPLDDEKVARTIGCNLRTWRRLKVSIWPEMTLDMAGGVFWQDRIRKEWEKAHAKVQRITKARQGRESKLNGDLIGVKPELNDPKTTPASNDSGNLLTIYRPENQNQNQNTTSSKKPARRLPADAPGSDHQALVAHIDTLYREATGGRKPTWGPKQGAMVKALLKAHGLEECKRRADVLWRTPPEWIRRGGGVPTLATLVANFDALAVPNQGTPTGPPGNRGLGVNGLLALAEKLKEHET